jgi:hypothetical protein
VVILLAPTGGITMHSCAALSSESFFAIAAIAQVKFQSQLAGVTLSRQNSPSDRRFNSSWLNLAFERLLLGASLRRHTKGTDSKPRELGPKHVKDIHKTFVRLEGTPLRFFLQGSRGIRGPRAKAPTDWRGGACARMQLKARSQRPCTDG